MGWDSRDTAALNAATKAGIKCFGVGLVENIQRPVMLNKIECPCQPSSEAPEKLLEGAIEAFTRFSPDDTLWVEITCEDIPKYVADAVAGLHGFGCRIIVSQGSKSTHGSGPLLDSSLCDVVKAANHGGTIWHPLEEALVSAT